MAGQRSAELRERAGNGVCEPKPQPRLKRIGDVAFDNNDPIYVVNGSPYYLSIPIGWNNGVAFIVFFFVARVGVASALASITSAPPVVACTVANRRAGIIR